MPSNIGGGQCRCIRTKTSPYRLQRAELAITLAIPSVFKRVLLWNSDDTDRVLAPSATRKGAGELNKIFFLMVVAYVPCVVIGNLLFILRFGGFSTAQQCHIPQGFVTC